MEQDIKEFWDLITTLGYSPWSFVASAAAIFFVRKMWEPSPLEIMGAREITIARLLKSASLVAGLVVGYFVQLGVSKGAYVGVNVGAAFVDTVAGYTIWSILSGIDPAMITKSIIKRFFPGAVADDQK